MSLMLLELLGNTEEDHFREREVAAEDWIKAKLEKTQTQFKNRVEKNRKSTMRKHDVLRNYCNEVEQTST